MLVFTQGGNNRIPHGCRPGIFTAHLDDARADRPGGRQQRTEIQIVCKYDITGYSRPSHDL